MAGKGNSTDLTPPMIQAAQRGLTTITGADTAWMSPGEPLQAMVPQTAGRQYDYQVATNLNIIPRAEERISFGDLRALADSYYLVRLAIETRKDQLVKLRWNIKPTDPKAKPDARCAELVKFFKQPDKRRNWQDWLRMLIEDVLVIDAPAVYFHPNYGDKPYAFEIIDGATIKVLLDEYGRQPLPPEPCYQQNMKGIPTVNYTSKELVYKPRNPRSWKAYGFSPVEQITTIVNMGLRREISQLQFYTEGNIPEALIATPNTWNPDQVKQYQEYWDSLFEGNTGNRRHAKFVPGGMSVHETKTAALTDAFDEWLARVVLYAFSLPPTAFIKQNNRATADSGKEQAEEEGLVPIMIWVEDFINHLIFTYWNYEDIEFKWEEEASIDPLIQAQVDQIYLTTNVLELNEVRERMGLEARDYEQEAKDAMANAAEAMPVKNDVADTKKPAAPMGKDGASAKNAQADDVKKKSYAKLSAANLKRADVLRGELTKFFKKVKPDVIGQITKAYATLQKADDSSDEIANQIDLDFQALIALTSKQLTAAAAEGVTDAQNKISNQGVEIDFDIMGIAKGVGDYRAAELVGMRYDGNGDLVPNPNAKWAITDGTRDLLAGDIDTAFKEGWTTDQLANALEENYAFSESRANTIARTEIARADMEGSMQAYRDSGVVAAKKWLLAEEPCEICQANAEDGIIDLDELFSSGDDAAPAHPNCECDVSPVVEDDSGSETEE
jgi:hypothetical protein